MKTIDFYQLFLLYYDFIIKRNLFQQLIVETVTLFLTYYMRQRQKTVLFNFYVYKLYFKIIVLLLPLTWKVYNDDSLELSWLRSRIDTDYDVTSDLSTLYCDAKVKRVLIQQWASLSWSRVSTLLLELSNNLETTSRLLLSFIDNKFGYFTRLLISLWSHFA